MFLQKKETNKQESFVYLDRNRSDLGRLKSLNDINELKMERLLEKKILSILKEIFIFLVFLFFLNWITFSNLSQSSYQYNQLFIHTFVKKQQLSQTIGLNSVRFSYDKYFLNTLLQ